MRIINTLLLIIIQTDSPTASFLSTAQPREPRVLPDQQRGGGGGVRAVRAPRQRPDARGHRGL
eukprot:198696-Prorocentrum_minimum.AAC.1